MEADRAAIHETEFSKSRDAIRIPISNPPIEIKRGRTGDDSSPFHRSKGRVARHNEVEIHSRPNIAFGFGGESGRSVWLGDEGIDGRCGGGPNVHFESRCPPSIFEENLDNRIGVEVDDFSVLRKYISAQLNARSDYLTIRYPSQKECSDSDPLVSSYAANPTNEAYERGLKFIRNVGGLLLCFFGVGLIIRILH